MFTSIDKALMAVVMGVLYLLNEFFGLSYGLTEDQVSGILAVVTPVLVWLIPNRRTP